LSRPEAGRGSRGVFLWEHAFSLLEKGLIAQSLSLSLRKPSILILGVGYATVLVLIPQSLLHLTDVVPEVTFFSWLLTAILVSSVLGGAVAKLAFDGASGLDVPLSSLWSALSLAVHRLPAVLLAHLTGLMVTALMLVPLLLMLFVPVLFNLLFVTLPFGLYVGCRFSCLIPVAILTDEGAVGSFRRCLRITAGNAWPVLVTLSMLVLVLGFAALLFGMFLFMFPMVFFALTCAVGIPAFICCETLIYSDLTERIAGAPDAAQDVEGVQPVPALPDGYPHGSSLTLKEYVKICPPRYNASYCPYCPYCTEREDAKYCGKHEVFL